MSDLFQLVNDVPQASPLAELLERLEPDFKTGHSEIHDPRMFSR